MTILTLRKAQEQEIKSLRSDARRLVSIARHLRERANELSHQLKSDERAEQARTNFFSKRAKVDLDVVLTPELDKELFASEVRAK